MRIAPEGIPFLVGAVGLLAVLGGVAVVRGGLWIAPALVWLPLTIWVAAFFRDPLRPGPRGDHLVIAPADGKVVSIVEMAEDDYLAGPAVRISIFMNVFNVHVNRHPVAGVVEHRHYRPGKFVNATLDKASTDNEQMSIGIASARGRVLVRQIAGLIARRIVTDHHPGDSVSQGMRLGLIRFGSRVDTFLPPEVAVRVQIGDRVSAGTSILAEWADGNSES